MILPTFLHPIQVLKEKELQETAQNAQLPYRALIQTDELYRCYELLLKDAEADMIRLSSAPDSSILSPKDARVLVENEEEEAGINEDVLRILSVAKEGPLTEVNLKGRGLISIPDAFGRISTLVLLDLSENKLKVIFVMLNHNFKIIFSYIAFLFIGSL